MRLKADWIRAAGLQRLLGLIGAAGHRAYLVGGCVRNALLGLPVADIDIATDARPETVAEIAASAGLRVVPTGIDHGTVTVIVDGVAHEVTTFRRDVATDGRRATIAYAATIEEDAARRDFTMNALYADAEGRILDPLGGLGDLMARRVRFVGDPEARIREDYLRILRFFRFHAWYGDPAAGPDPQGLAACARNRAGIETLSRERIGHEMRRLLAAPDPVPAVSAMDGAGILALVLPGADAEPLGRAVRLEAGRAPDWLGRLAALGGEDPASALRLSRREARRLAAIREAACGVAGAAEIAYREGAETARAAMILRAARHGAPLPDDLEQAIAKGAGAVFPVRAADLKGRFAGPDLGARLSELEARWIASGFELSREQLLA